MKGYSARDVARMLDVPVARVRAYVRAGFLQPARGPGRRLRFSFQDLVLLRAARGLLAARVPARKVRRALDRLRAQLPDGRPLSGVHITADGDNVIVRDGGAAWEAETGQALFDFQIPALGRKIAPLNRRPRALHGGLDAEAWYRRGCAAEKDDPAAAREAYRRALELDPSHADAHVNLGRLLHETGDLTAAEAHYRAALAARAGNATASFNLGVALEDQGRIEEACAAYQAAVDAEPRYADAHWNLARLCERLGRRAAALRHLGAYRRLARSGA